MRNIYQQIIIQFTNKQLQMKMFGSTCRSSDTLSFSMVHWTNHGSTFRPHTYALQIVRSMSKWRQIIGCHNAGRLQQPIPCDSLIEWIEKLMIIMRALCAWQCGVSIQMCSHYIRIIRHRFIRSAAFPDVDSIYHMLFSGCIPSVRCARNEPENHIADHSNHIEES